MKKTLLIALAAIATIFTSCSSDINNDNDDSNNGQGKGMTLIANVEQDDTRATLTTSDDTSGKWSFAYTDNDKVYVGNDQMENNYYTFTKSGEKFSSTEAKATNSNVNWYAYYPGTTIDLTYQAGTEASAAQLYALAGATTAATTGADGLKINMKAKAAVLRIVKVDNYGPCDIYLMTKEGKYVSGLKAKKNEAGFDVETSNTKVSVFNNVDHGKAGIYYVIVPADVKISVYNSDKLIKTTKDPGLKAGNYYTLTSGPTTGTATAKLADGKTNTVKWVQLWIGGPRIATENVAEEIAFKDDVKKGENYVWGSLWRTASCSDVSSLYYYDEVWKSSLINKKLVEPTYDYQDKHGLTLTGKQPGYTKNSLFLNGFDNSNKDHVAGKFLLSDGNKEGYGTTMNFIVYGKEVFVAYVQSDDHDNSPYPVRPVLSQKTVLWGGQNIK